MDLIKLYTSILDAAGAVVDSQGFVSDNKKIYGGENTPLVIKGKRLVLPTDEQLRSISKNNSIAFHPLFENIMRSESDIVTTLRKMISIRLSYTTACVMNSLLTIATSTKEHHKLTPDQGEFLSLIKDVDATTLTNFVKYLAAVAKANEATHLAYLYLKRGGKVGDAKFNRVCIVNFPAYDEIKQHTDLTKSLRGVKFRIKDRDAILKLFEYIFTNIESVTDFYSAGSNSDVAPYMDCLMKSFCNVAAKLNDVLALFHDKIDHSAQLTINSEWVDSFQDLTLMLPWIRSVPMQSGNEGGQRAPNAVPNNDTTIVPVQTTIPISSVTPPQVNQPQLPVYQNKPNFAVANIAPSPPVVQQPNDDLVSSNGINFKALMNRGFNRPMHHNTPQQMMPQQQIYNQQPMYAQQQYGQQPIQRIGLGGSGYQQPQQGQVPRVNF